MPRSRLAAHVFHLRCDHVDNVFFDHFDKSTHRLGQHSWCSSMKTVLQNNDCADHWRRRFVPANWRNVLNRVVSRHENQLNEDEFARLPTLRLYRSLPRKYGPESWL